MARYKYGLLVSLVVSAILAGCSGKPGPDPAGAAAPNGTRGAKQAAQVELTVSAAASLTDALNDIQRQFADRQPRIKLVFNYGGSGALQRQIEQGAPADLFLSASESNMKALVNEQLVDASSQRALLGNRLVLVVPEDSKAVPKAPADLTKTEYKTIAIGEPGVPAGDYAREALGFYHLEEVLKKKTVLGKDVRQVLTYVESGNADAGFVYRTDALTSKKVKIAAELDPHSYRPVEYPVGIVSSTKHPEEAKTFYAFLQSPEAMDIFAKYGFTAARTGERPK